MGRTTVKFECTITASGLEAFEQLERQIFNEVKKRKEAVCEEANGSLKDFYWSQYKIFDSDSHATVILSYRPRSDFDKLTVNELTYKLSEKNERLEKAREQLEDIEALREEDYNAYGFMSKKDYKERIRELDADVFALKSDVELIENLLKEGSQ